MIHLVILIKYLVPKAWEFSLQNFIMQRVQLSGGVTMSAFCREFKQVIALPQQVYAASERVELKLNHRMHNNLVLQFTFLREKCQTVTDFGSKFFNIPPTCMSINHKLSGSSSTNSSYALTQAF